MNGMGFLAGGILVLALAAGAEADETEKVDRKFGVSPMFGFAAGQPLGFSASAGLIVGSVPTRRVKCAFSYWSDGVFLQAEPGIGGGKLSLGAATSNGLFGVAAKASLVRTWGKTWGTEPNVTYAGGELELAMFGKLSAGWLWRVDGSTGKASMFTWGVGLGF
jgi:hypothetical protein